MKTATTTNYKNNQHMRLIKNWTQRNDLINIAFISNPLNYFWISVRISESQLVILIYRENFYETRYEDKKNYKQNDFCQNTSSTLAYALSHSQTIHHQKFYHQITCKKTNLHCLCLWWLCEMNSVTFNGCTANLTALITEYKSQTFSYFFLFA